MILVDVNVLVQAFREEMPEHEPAHQWLQTLLWGGDVFGVMDGVLCGFVRIVTQKPFNPPTPTREAVGFVGLIRSAPNCCPVSPDQRQWRVFIDLCQSLGPRGKLVQDAYWASFALANDCEWVTFDRDFGRFPGLRWKSPLESQARTNPR